MESFAIILNSKELFNVAAKFSVLDVPEGPDKTSEILSGQSI